MQRRLLHYARNDAVCRHPAREALRSETEESLIQDLVTLDSSRSLVVSLTRLVPLLVLWPAGGLFHLQFLVPEFLQLNLQ